jgi:hypothetical protein
MHLESKIQMLTEFRFFGIKGLAECLLIPTISVYYTKYGFFETGVYTPLFVLGIKWLKFEVGLEYQKDPYIK